MEDHAQSGLLCELVVGSDDVQMRESELVELLVDTGATEHVCGPHDFTHAALKNGPLQCQGEELRVGFTVVDGSDQF